MVATPAPVAAAMCTIGSLMYLLPAAAHHQWLVKCTVIRSSGNKNGYTIYLTVSTVGICTGSLHRSTTLLICRQQNAAGVVRVRAAHLQFSCRWTL